MITGNLRIYIAYQDPSNNWSDGLIRISTSTWYVVGSALLSQLVALHLSVHLYGKTIAPPIMFLSLLKFVMEGFWPVQREFASQGLQLERYKFGPEYQFAYCPSVSSL